MKRCGELAASTSGAANSGRKLAGASVVAIIWSIAHSDAWLTIARNRPVWPAIQLAMYPPNDPPIIAVRVPSTSSRATAASVIAITSPNVRGPQSR